MVEKATGASEHGGMAEVTDDEIEKMVAMLSRRKRYEGMKIPGIGSFSRDELIHKLKARDPEVFLLIVLYRGGQREVIEHAKRDILTFLDNAPGLDRRMLPNMFIGENEKGYTPREIARHIREETPEGVAIVQAFYDLRCNSRMKHVKRSINSQPGMVQALIAIRSLIVWGRSKIEEVLKLGKNEQKKLE
ncbi:MAG: hypothetical protein NTX63_01760 [Candidatus Peregrinibacteria bacterium]|nr:hypothetical protein [Candidatus Peregrinibacteria bacterium]